MPRGREPFAGNSGGADAGGRSVDKTMFLVYFMTMIRININEAKTHLSRYLARLRRGEVIVICKRNEPIAEIRALPRARKRKRPIGLARGRLTVPASFFEPLPENLMREFEGRDR